MAESPIALLRAHSRHAPWNARGLAAHVTALVDAAGVRPTNASARAAPSARSIRFYVANGLLERPEGTGTAATYNYRHFLQLLSIKMRQREGISLDNIKKEMRDVTAPFESRASSSPPRAAVETGKASDDDPSASWRHMLWLTSRAPRSRRFARFARRSARAMREAVRAALDVRTFARRSPP
jgi:DNA-binding transcriptional MerR regulator